MRLLLAATAALAMPLLAPMSGAHDRAALIQS